MQEIKNWEQLPLVLSTPQVAKILGVSRANAYVLVHREGFPSVRIGDRRWIVPRDALRRWLEQESTK